MLPARLREVRNPCEVLRVQCSHSSVLSADRGDSDLSRKGCFRSFCFSTRRQLVWRSTGQGFPKAAASKSPLVVLFEAPPAQKKQDSFLQPNRRTTSASDQQPKDVFQAQSGLAWPSRKVAPVSLAANEISPFGLGPPCLAPNPVAMPLNPRLRNRDLSRWSSPNTESRRRCIKMKDESRCLANCAVSPGVCIS
jgi:hypothetical protein